MTVKELIEFLQQMPPDAEVYTDKEHIQTHKVIRREANGETWVDIV